MSIERTPIEFRDIRAGDLIRSETTDDVALGDNLLATEWRADEETKYRSPASGVAFFLLDRPQPPVELPSVVTLGTLSWHDEGAICDRHETALWGPSADGKRVVSESSSIPVRIVVGFIPILTHADDETPVPTAALDRFISVRKTFGATLGDINKASRNFLAAIEAAEKTNA